MSYVAYIGHALLRTQDMRLSQHMCPRTGASCSKGSTLPAARRAAPVCCRRLGCSCGRRCLCHARGASCCCCHGGGAGSQIPNIVLYCRDVAPLTPLSLSLPFHQGVVAVGHLLDVNKLPLFSS